MRLRPMTLVDADFMLQLKNDPETRKWAIATHEPIKREDHIKFLKEHLAEFKVIHKWDKTNIGAVWVHPDNEISIWLLPEFREFGIATRVLSGDIIDFTYQGTWTRINRESHWARIVDGNVASFRAFLKAGFRPTEHKDNYYILK